MSDQDFAAHDFNAQRAETRETYTELRDGPGLPEFADVDYFLVPASEGSDWLSLADALSKEGYDCEWIEPAAEDGEEEDGNYLIATLADQMISADSIWVGEELATRIGLEHGFTPDGWGLLGDSED
ncbi:ribonuclease E inhibitor RraB [Sagittula salina]|uniref:Ribonuclease E inhibitor RraB n=1 Tax=Sagittula salina TaxID=2820268 RepID=A0A940S339_9RHOB|nr:ribonuclease E inhibitor RraB [Sagittula salina]MBP0482345.1 ribonuclease E inhibitor RraB [Sagittula salina]